MDEGKGVSTKSILLIMLIIVVLAMLGAVALYVRSLPGADVPYETIVIKEEQPEDFLNQIKEDSEAAEGAIDVDKIREVIGQGGKVINEIIAKCDNCKIDIEDDGKVTIYHMNRETINKAKKYIDDIVRVAKIGEIYEGVVNRVEDYGAFVNLFGEVDGLCHVSRLGWGYINRASDVVHVGDKLKVVVSEIDEKGKVKVSHREFVEKPAGFVEKPVEKKEHKFFHRDHKDNK